MSSLFYPYRNHHRSYGNHHHHLSPYSRQPTSFTASPWNSSALYRDNDPFGLGFNFDQPFHQPFLSLFNDTFSQLDRLSNELNTRLGDGDSDLGKMLTLAPKFDIKETDKEFILEGELPGVEKKDINLDFVDDNTLVLKTRTEKVRQEGAQPQTQPQGRIEGDKDVQMSGANQESAQANTGAQSQDKPSDTAVATTNQNKEVAAPTTQYHLTERSVGTFQRVFSLPGEINHEGVKASLKNGILTVTVPKVVKEAKEEKKSRSVTVEEVPADEEEGEKAKL
jgi:HSP20 family molecular chaperone IbpA